MWGVWNVACIVQMLIAYLKLLVRRTEGRRPLGRPRRRREDNITMGLK